MSEREPRGTFDALPWIRDLELPAAQKSVLYAIASRIDHENACFPSQERLARDAGMSDRSLRTHLAELESAGLIERQARSRRPGEGRGRTSDRIVLRIGEMPREFPADSSGPEPATNRKAASGESADQPANPARPTGKNRPTYRKTSSREHDTEHAKNNDQRPPPDNSREAASEPAAGGGGGPSSVERVEIVEAALDAAADRISWRYDPEDPGRYRQSIRNRLRRQHASSLHAACHDGSTVDALVDWLLDQELIDPPLSPPAAAAIDSDRPDCPACSGTDWVLDDDANAHPCPHLTETAGVA